MSASDDEMYVWPTGLGNMALDTLPGHLRDTGLLYARRAVEQYSSWDDLQLLDAAVAIGSAVELLAKAMLADVAPALLLDRQQDDIMSVMLLAGVSHPKGDKLEALQVRSLSASQAIDRLKRLRLLNGWAESDKVVFLVRNAATHMGLVSPETVQGALVVMVRFCDHAREYFGKDQEAWWGAANVDIAAQMLADAEKRLTLLIGAKFSAARQVFARRRADLPAGLQDTILGAIADARPSMEMELARRLPCPSCGYSGWAVGFGRTDGVSEPESFGMAVGTDMDVEAFQCHVCGLVLDGWQEVAEGGLPDVLHVESVQSP